jgi:hypothetical protein
MFDVEHRARQVPAGRKARRVRRPMFDVEHRCALLWPAGSTGRRAAPTGNAAIVAAAALGYALCSSQDAAFASLRRRVR